MNIPYLMYLCRTARRSPLKELVVDICRALERLKAISAGGVVWGVGMELSCNLVMMVAT